MFILKPSPKRLPVLRWWLPYLHRLVSKAAGQLARWLGKEAVRGGGTVPGVPYR